MKIINPTNGRLHSDVRYMDLPMVQRKAMSLRENQMKWSRTPIKDRVEKIRKLGSILRKRKEELAKTISMEMGKPIKFALIELDKCINLCDYAGKNAEKFLKEYESTSDKTKAFVRFEALGTILVVSPWNYPFWLSLRSTIPSLCAGNCVMIKQATAVPDCARQLRKILIESGLENYVAVIQTDPAAAGSLIDNNLVEGLAVVGSTSTGREIGKKAGENLKPMTLELGGSNPFIVFDDADLARAAKEAVMSRMLNSGQSCDSAKRILVHKKVATEFESLVISEVNKLKIGDPLSMETDIGPLINESACNCMDEYIADAKKLGARVMYGGQRLNREGSYYMPTVICDVTTEMKVFQEEVFGPIMPITIFGSDKEAIELANQTAYGLGASVWSESKERIQSCARNIQTGMVFANKRTTSDVRLPFGGIKNSGYGRELGIEGFRAFTNVKTVVIS